MFSNFFNMYTVTTKDYIAMLRLASTIAPLQMCLRIRDGLFRIQMDFEQLEDVSCGAQYWGHDLLAAAKLALLPVGCGVSIFDSVRPNLMFGAGPVF
jgi:hypothetical protein